MISEQGSRKREMSVLDQRETMCRCRSKGFRTIHPPPATADRFNSGPPTVRVELMLDGYEVGTSLLADGVRVKPNGCLRDAQAFAQSNRSKPYSACFRKN